MKRIAILQSNYIPWKGYFDIIRSVDEFVIYDDAQYTRRDWRNRNLIKTSKGLMWLTIPVQVKNKFSQNINETKISDSRWIKEHLMKLRHNYSAAAHFREYIDWLSGIYESCRNMVFLSDINLFFINEINRFLDINTRISFSGHYRIEGDRTMKIINICRDAGADVYLTGPAAKSYLRKEEFDESGIELRWMDYSGYKEYDQLYPPFVHEVSILDLILNMGLNSVDYLKRS